MKLSRSKLSDRAGPGPGRAQRPEPPRGRCGHEVTFSFLIDESVGDLVGDALQTLVSPATSV